jgi:hypothetical protein
VKVRRQAVVPRVGFRKRRAQGRDRTWDEANVVILPLQLTYIFESVGHTYCEAMQTHWMDIIVSPVAYMMGAATTCTIPDQAVAPDTDTSRPGARMTMR